MVELYRLLIEALKTISITSGQVTVIEGSLHSTEKNFPLPAIVVDYEPSLFNPLTEDGAKWSVDPAYSLVLHVKRTKSDQSIEQAKIEELMTATLAKVATVFKYGFRLTDVVIDALPFGLDQEAFGCGLLIRAQGYEYNFK